MILSYLSPNAQELSKTMTVCKRFYLVGMELLWERADTGNLTDQRQRPYPPTS